MGEGAEGAEHHQLRTEGRFVVVIGGSQKKNRKQNQIQQEGQRGRLLRKAGTFCNQEVSEQERIRDWGESRWSGADTEYLSR